MSNRAQDNWNNYNTCLNKDAKMPLMRGLLLRENI